MPVNLKRALQKLREDIRAAEHAADQEPPQLDEAVMWLRSAELRIHDCRRQLEKQMYGYRRGG